MSDTALAAFLAPTLGAAFYWLVFKVARKGHNWLWKRLPEGRLRRLLLGHIPGTKRH
jgi:hypothetical protein